MLDLAASTTAAAAAAASAMASRLPTTIRCVYSTKMQFARTRCGTATWVCHRKFCNSSNGVTLGQGRPSHAGCHSGSVIVQIVRVTSGRYRARVRVLCRHCNQGNLSFGPFRFLLANQITSCITSQVVVLLHLLYVSCRSRGGRGWAYASLRFVLVKQYDMDTLLEPSSALVLFRFDDSN